MRIERDKIEAAARVMFGAREAWLFPPADCREWRSLSQHEAGGWREAAEAVINALTTTKAPTREDILRILAPLTFDDINSDLTAADAILALLDGGDQPAQSVEAKAFYRRVRRFAEDRSANGVLPKEIKLAYLELLAAEGGSDAE